MDVKRIKEILDKRTSIDSSTGCWLYLGTNLDGYGQIQIDYMFHYVHVLSAKLFLGYENSADFVVCHKTTCPNKNCWNPEHIYIGTYYENSQDISTLRNGRGRYSGVTHCVNGHEFTEENTYIRPNGNRSCRICLKDRDKKHKARVKEAFAIQNEKFISKDVN